MADRRLLTVKTRVPREQVSVYKDSQAGLQAQVRSPSLLSVVPPLPPPLSRLERPLRTMIAKEKRNETLCNR